MRFKSIIGMLDVEVMTIDRIEELHARKKPMAIYVNRKFGFVIGWETSNWFLWELPRNGEEVFEQSEGEEGNRKKPDNLWIPISISSRYQWGKFVPSVNLFVHRLEKSDISLEKYIRDNLQIMLGKENVSFLESGTGMAPVENVGFSTLYTETKEGRVYQLQKFVMKNDTVFTLSASNIAQVMPQEARKELADIINSFAFIGKTPGQMESAVGKLKGMLEFFRKK